MMNHEGELYTPGEIAPPGRYVRIDSPSRREIVLERPGELPASLDGHVAVYTRLPSIDALLAGLATVRGRRGELVHPTA